MHMLFSQKNPTSPSSERGMVVDAMVPSYALRSVGHAKEEVGGLWMRIFETPTLHVPRSIS